MIGKKFLVILGTVVVLTAGMSGAVYVKTSHALMPGPLSNVMKEGTGEIRGEYTSHADLEGECGHCHVPLHCLAEDACTDCHIEIARQRQDLQGLHGRIPARNCPACHTEHQGKDADITRFAFQHVDHNALSGFSLARHQTDYGGNPLGCTSCHLQDEYMDHSLDCIACHQEENPAYMAGHMREYGGACLDCHDGQDRMATFEHGSTYALGEAHRVIACSDCHEAYVYKGTPRNCGDCHAEPDVHTGAFGKDCAYCHEAASWTPAKLSQHTFRLDHGDEGQLPCTDCHEETYAGYACASCHEAQFMFEVHAEYQVGAADLGEDCAVCHPTGVPGEGQQMMFESGLTGQGNQNPLPDRSDQTGSEDHGRDGRNDKSNSPSNGGGGGKP